MTRWSQRTSPRRPSPVGPLVGGLLHLLLASLVVGSVLAHPLDRVLGSGDVDVWNHAWGPWWWWHSLSAGQLPWHTQLLSWPDGGTLWFIDPLLGLVGAPLVPLLGAAGAWNVSLWLMVAFASWSAGRLARALGAGGTAPWVASAAYVGSAWVVCELHNGISEAVNIGSVALALAWTEDAVHARGPLVWAKVGLGLGLASLASPYLGVGLAAALSLRGLPHLRWAWVGGLVGAAMTLLPILAIRAQFSALDAVVKRPTGMNQQLALHNAVDPRTFFMPGGFRSVDLSAEGFAHSMYLGVVVLLLVAVAVLRRPRRALPWLLAALVTALLALGPWLYWGDGWVLTPQGGKYALPWFYAQSLVPELAMTHPLRLAVATLALCSGLAAVGAQALLGSRWAVLLLPLVLVDGLLWSGAPWPVDTADATLPAVYDDIAKSTAAASRYGVLDLPTDVGPTMATSRYLFWQTGHHRPIPYAVDARASTCSLLVRPAFRQLAALSDRRQDEALRINVSGTGVGAASVRTLGDNGIRWIVLHRSLDPAAAARLETRIAHDLGPGQVVGDAVRWDLGPDVATAHTLRVASPDSTQPGGPGGPGAAGAGGDGASGNSPR